MDKIAQHDQEKKKVYEFALLRRRETFLRADIVTACLVALALLYNFGWRLTDKEDLLGIGMLVLGILFNGVLLLSNFWSVACHEFFAYASLQETEIERCTHVRVRIDNKKQNVVKRHIVPLLTQPVEFAPGKVNKAY
jgi:hypothetical protein